MLKDLGRASAEDLAIAMSEEFGGARGLAKIAKTLLTSPRTQPATKARILENVKQLLSSASKLYGDRAKLTDLNKEQLEQRLMKLWKKHHGVVPLPGIDLHVHSTIEPVHQSQEEAGQVTAQQ